MLYKLNRVLLSVDKQNKIIKSTYVKDFFLLISSYSADVAKTLHTKTITSFGSWSWRVEVEVEVCLCNVVRLGLKTGKISGALLSHLTKTGESFRILSLEFVLQTTNQQFSQQLANILHLLRVDDSSHTHYAIGHSWLFPFMLFCTVLFYRHRKQTDVEQKARLVTMRESFWLLRK